MFDVYQNDFCLTAETRTSLNLKKSCEWVTILSEDDSDQQAQFCSGSGFRETS